MQNAIDRRPAGRLPSTALVGGPTFGRQDTRRANRRSRLTLRAGLELGLSRADTEVLLHALAEEGPGRRPGNDLAAFRMAADEAAALAGLTRQDLDRANRRLMQTLKQAPLTRRLLRLVPGLRNSPALHRQLLLSAAGAAAARPSETAAAAA